MDEGIQLNSVGSDSFRQDTSLASQRQNSLLDSSPSRRQGSPSLVGFSLRFKNLLKTRVPAILILTQAVAEAPSCKLSET